MAKGGATRPAKNKTHSPRASKVVKLNVRRIAEEKPSVSLVAPVKKRKSVSLRKKNRTKGVEKRKEEEMKKHVEDLVRREIVRARIEKQKRIVLWTGVIFFMSLIAFGWVFSLKNSFQEISAEETAVNLNGMSKDIDGQIKELKDNMEKAKESFGLKDPGELNGASSTVDELFATSSEASVEVVAPISATSTEIKTDQKTLDEIESLKLKIDELEKKMK
ncbi:MAG: hypothetical protein ABH881_02815 [bacterium]